MERSDAETLTGYASLPPELFETLPLGRRIYVIREKTRDKEGSIILPEQSQEARSVGWVVAAGPDIGLPSTMPAGGRWPWAPHTILGTKVVFGAWKGQALKPDFDDPTLPWVLEAGGPRSVKDDAGSPFRIITDMDIFAVYRGKETP
jgi:co-chaperonin GroES (HSP10)